MATDPRNLTPAQLDKARWRMRGAIAVRPKGVDGVVYWSESANGNGRVSLVAYRGRALKHCAHYGFRSAERARQWIESWAESLRKAADAKAERAEARKAFRHSLQVGDVLKSSWGYDQTNIDYYQVTRRSASCVWIRAIAQQSQETASMQGECVPAPGHFIGKERRHRVTQGNAVRIASYAHAFKVEPTKVGGVDIYPTARWTAYA